MTATRRRMKEMRDEIANLKKLAALRLERGRLRTRLEERRRPPSIERILGIVSSEFKVTVEAIVGPSRTEWVVIPRHVAMYLVREIDTGDGLATIGHAFGGRDHGTVLNAIRRVKDRMDVNENFARKVADLILQCVPPANLAPIIERQSEALTK